jgi:hypothetical protein
MAASLGLNLLPPHQQPSQTDTTSVVLRFAAAASTYRVGEEIPLELEFRGKAGPEYYLSTETSDRSGRMWTERYEATPAAGWDDPLADFYADGYVGGGFRGRQKLGRARIS